MDLFLDTAEVDAWESLMPLGLFKGITTNPLLGERAGLEYARIDWTTLAQRAADLGASELHAQLNGQVEGYTAWCTRLLAAGEKARIRTVVKIPLTRDGIRAAPAIRALGCPILMTAAYDAKQMLVACALGADYIAPYFARMLEQSIPAEDVLRQMRAIGASDDHKTRVLVASLRSTDQLTRLAAQGHDCFTISPELVEDLLEDPHTEAAAQAFERAARSQDALE